MRTDVNPVKENSKIELENYHRVIVPVYIPNFEGYFADMYNVFRLCIESLLATVHSKTRITIYNNGCCDDIIKYIDDLYKEYEQIDQVFHSKINVGKINALLASAKGNLEPFITITDADVLFKPDWQRAVEEVFICFPEAGMVSPVPNSRALSNYTVNNWRYGVCKGKLYFDNVVDPEGMDNFGASLGPNYHFYEAIHMQRYLVLANKAKTCEAVMGCGHFVATLRREVFDKGSNEPARFKIVGGIESKFIDEPNETLGFLRLATKDNYAYHLGNNAEEWAISLFDRVIKTSKRAEPFNISSFPEPVRMRQIAWLKRLINKIIRSKKMRKPLFRRLGLIYNGDY